MYLLMICIIIEWLCNGLFDSRLFGDRMIRNHTIIIDHIISSGIIIICCIIINWLYNYYYV